MYGIYSSGQSASHTTAPRLPTFCEGLFITSGCLGFVLLGFCSASTLLEWFPPLPFKTSQTATWDTGKDTKQVTTGVPKASRLDMPAHCLLLPRASGVLGNSCRVTEATGCLETCGVFVSSRRRSRDGAGGLRRVVARDEVMCKGTLNCGSHERNDQSGVINCFDFEIRGLIVCLYELHNLCQRLRGHFSGSILIVCVVAVHPLRRSNSQ